MLECSGQEINAFSGPSQVISKSSASYLCAAARQVKITSSCMTSSCTAILQMPRSWGSLVPNTSYNMKHGLLHGHQAPNPQHVRILKIIATCCSIYSDIVSVLSAILCRPCGADVVIADAELSAYWLQDRQEAVQDMAWRQGMEVNNARDETEDITEQYWELHDRMQEKQREMEALQAELETARSQAAGLQVHAVHVKLCLPDDQENKL